MLSNRTSQWSIAAAVLCIALLATSWFLLIDPRRADASSVRSQTVQTDSRAAQLQLQIAQLKAEFADLPKRQQELAAIKRQLPAGAGIPALIRQLQDIAAQDGVTLNALSPGTPAIIADPGAAVPTTAGPGDVVNVPLSLTVTGEYFEASLFVRSLQTKIVRSYLISGIDAANAQDDTSTATPTAADTNPPTPTPTSTSSAPVTVPTVTSTAVTLDQVTLSITGSVFVLLDGSSTLADVTREAKTATLGTVAPTSTATAPTTNPTTVPGPTAS